MATPVTQQTQRLTTQNTGNTYNKDFNDGYNQGWLAQRHKDKIDIRQLISELDNSALWSHRLESAKYIAVIAILLVVATAVIIGFVSLLIQTLIANGITNIVAPGLLLLVIGFLVGRLTR